MKFSVEPACADVFPRNDHTVAARGQQAAAAAAADPAAAIPAVAGPATSRMDRRAKVSPNTNKRTRLSESNRRKSA